MKANSIYDLAEMWLPEQNKPHLYSVRWPELTKH